LYPELQEPNAPWPTNPPTPARGTYVIAYDALLAVGMGALRSLDDRAAEVRRMYVLPSHRRHGVGRLILGELERRALDFGYRVLRLETGCRQQAALQLYETSGFRRIDPFGPYTDDPPSVCFEKQIVP